MTGKRLFISLDVPADVAGVLVRLDPHLPGVRWLRGEQMHLTLSFLGQVGPEAEEALRGALSKISWKRFLLPLCGLGLFPSQGAPRILWIGVGNGHPHLFQLHKRVHEAALHAGLEPELRPFRPHITLARCRDISAASVRPYLRENRDLEIGMFQVESFFLNSSALTSAGSVYTGELEVPAR